MKHSKLKSLVCMGVALAAIGSSSAAGVTVEQAADGSVKVQAEAYQAAFDTAGNWTSLIVKGREMLGDGMKFPGKEAPSSINVRTGLLALRNQNVIVEFAFEEGAFELSVEGAQAQIGISSEVSAIVSGKQGVKGRDAKNVPDVRKVISGAAAFSLDPGLVFRAGSLVVGQPKAKGQTARVRFECGVAAEAEKLVEVSGFQPVAPATKTVASLPGGEPVRLEATVRNLSAAPVETSLVYTISDAFVAGIVSDPVSLPIIELAGGESRKVEIPLDLKAPGIFWVNLEVRKGTDILQRERTAFVFDAGNFRPPLTRPADFETFWKTRLEEVRKIPLEPVIKEIPARGTEAAGHYEVTIKGPDGKPLTFELQVPRKPGKYLALFGGKMSDKAGNAGLIQLVFSHKQWPDEATYNRWVSAADNNHLDCYLLAVRLTDYLRSRDDVDRIFLFGASRQGPIQLVNAALDSSKVCAVDAHVPTSMGLSWESPRYKGWGKTPNPPSMAAYVDPVNFAPDIRVPFLLDEGVYDGLSPAPGALAFFNEAVNAPWKRISIEPGGHGYFTSGFRSAARAELEKFLGYSLEGSIDEGVMREH